MPDTQDNARKLEELRDIALRQLQATEDLVQSQHTLAMRRRRAWQMLFWTIVLIPVVIYILTVVGNLIRPGMPTQADRPSAGP